jgi:hypothetical protein
MMTRRDDTGRETPGSGCEVFEATLPDYLDDTLAPDVAGEAAAHVAACATCRELVHDLRGIRADARALPVLHPPRDLWQGIEARIAGRSAVSSDAPVAHIAARAGSARTTARRRWFGSHYATRVSALAAGLVVATAGITWSIRTDRVRALSIPRRSAWARLDRSRRPRNTSTTPRSRRCTRSSSSGVRGWIRRRWP